MDYVGIKAEFLMKNLSHKANHDAEGSNHSSSAKDVNSTEATTKHDTEVDNSGNETVGGTRDTNVDQSTIESNNISVIDPNGTDHSKLADSIVSSDGATAKADTNKIDTDKSDNKNAKNNGNNNNSNKKKRPRDFKPDSNDRICHFVIKGNPCPFGGTCQYNHDTLEFLSRKPADIGEKCYHYNTYGWCQNGIMCRFGSKHIDKEKGVSLVRKDDEGGVQEKVMINVLDKKLQVVLRKKKYNYKLVLKDVESRAVTHCKPKDNPETDELISDDLQGDKNDPKRAKTEADEGHDPKQVDTLVESEEIPSEPMVIAKNQDSSDPYDDFVKLVDFSNKVYVAPLTTIGNLPFRRILKDFGADITCGEMALAENLQQGQASEWALLRRHKSETIFGIQLATGHKDQMDRTAALLRNEVSSDFIDLNCGCPIDLVCNRGCGASLMNKPNRLLDIVKSMTSVSGRSVTVKIRTGWDEKNPSAHKLVPELQKIANGRIAAIMVHGRSRLQRYSKLANWEYVLQVAKSQNPELKRIPVIGNGDILTWDDWNDHQTLIRDQTDDLDEIGLCSCAMIGRGAIIKPWLPTELKEQRHYDISASERFDILKTFCNYGLEHWGSDQQGVNTTRRFLLEWMSFLYKYVPAGLTDRPQKINQRPPLYFGRSDTETLLASANCKDWIKISEMFLGPVPEGFSFQPKHKSNSYSQDSHEDVSNG